jgi:hypothetical protein
MSRSAYGSAGMVLIQNGGFSWLWDLSRHPGRATQIPVVAAGRNPKSCQVARPGFETPSVEISVSPVGQATSGASGDNTHQSGHL